MTEIRDDEGLDISVLEMERLHLVRNTLTGRDSWVMDGFCVKEGPTASWVSGTSEWLNGNVI